MKIIGVKKISIKSFKNKKNPYKVTNKQIKDYMNENNWS